MIPTVEPVLTRKLRRKQEVVTENLCGNELVPYHLGTTSGSESSVMVDRARNLVQYVVVRGDLVRTLGWPLGAVIAQSCHAATAVIHLNYSDPDTQEYLAELDTMHKVVLEAPNEATLTALSEILQDNGVAHKLWVEQPENFPTCLALKPYPKEMVHSHLRKFKLFK
ncbi:putative peptidyl-tRNA hydrolase PTRHD1 [Arapaima gigas]